MLTKESIVERLLEQGHIVIQCANRILNHKGGYLTDVEDLRRDGNITTSEAIVLINDNPTPTQPIYPPNVPNTDWTWDPNRTGNPYWQVTCSNEEFTSK